VTVVPAALLKDLQRQVTLVAEDLRRQAERVPELGARLEGMYRAANEVGRTGETWNAWLTAQSEQAASSWVVACTFIRFCEDNDLTAHRWIASRDANGNATTEAADAEAAWIRRNPRLTAREWLREAFTWLRATRAGQALFPDTDFVWWWDISADMADALIAAFRRRDADGVRLAHDFHSPELDTRFLGDLYQDLSEHVRKRYALLQTPEFIGDFILDRTLTPAIDDFGLDGLKLIDPACGSGHFLLGAFDRLLQAWAVQAPGMDERVRVQKVLDSIHGVDINPTATAITKFRLMVAALQACGVTRLDDPGIPALRLNVATGDSLLYASKFGGRQTELQVQDGSLVAHRYDWEDIDRYPGILAHGRYHVVVGNPPYITVKDKALNQAYRDRYPTCHMKYALSVPFTELFFRLAVRDAERPGYVGQITANSFMKREFGKKLIEEFFAAKVELTHVIDTSGAYIPGHGTPTVILIGKNRDRNRLGTIRAVLGIRGEPSQPEDPRLGLVWRSISGHIDQPGTETEYVSVADLPREWFTAHPWTLGGGGSAQLQTLIESMAQVKLGELVESIGITCFTLEDDVYVFPERCLDRRMIPKDFRRPMVLGDGLRDWGISVNGSISVFPYDFNFLPVEVENERVLYLHFWPYRTNLSKNIMFGGRTKVAAGLRWSEFGRLTVNKLRTPLSITFAFVATHNHFVLDRGGKVFKQSAPVIKLRERATEDDHLRLIGILNSSTACFWLKHVSQKKGGASNSGGGRSDQPWSWSYEFTGTTLQDFPLPEGAPLERARRLDALAQELAAVTPQAVCAKGVPTREALAEARRRYHEIRAEMIAVQEELDWEVYKLYGLLDEDLTYHGGDLPGLALGQRAFEIVLGRKVLDGEVETEWFARHGSTPIRDIPAEWPQAYRDLVRRRIEMIENKPFIGLVERPEHKRRWAAEPYEKMQAEALRTSLLDRLEDRRLWFDEEGRPRALSAAQLADLVRTDADFRQVMDLYLGRPDYDITAEVAALLKDEHVPYLAAYRYTESGLRKRQDWEHVWALQRREDAGEKVEIPVPPKYGPKDFAAQSYWRHRGKLDVPKERFIGYPGAERDGDPTPVYGWAGWDHLQQAKALAILIIERGYPTGDPRVTPLLAGIAELEPWLHQWHNQYDAVYGEPPAGFFTRWLETKLSEHGLTREALAAWRPETKQRGRRARKGA